MRPIAGAAVAAVIVVAGIGGYLIATGAMSSGSSQTIYSPGSDTVSEGSSSSQSSEQSAVTTSTIFYSTVTSPAAGTTTVTSCSSTVTVTVTETFTAEPNQTTVTTTLVSTVTSTQFATTVTMTGCAVVTTTTTQTTTATLNTTQGNPPSVTNGTASLEFLGSSSNGSTLILPVRNTGESPLNIAYVVVNGVAIYPNGTTTWLSVTPSPIPPGSSATISINSPAFACAGCDFHITLVTDQGLEIKDYVYFAGGAISTTTTTFSTST